MRAGKHQQCLELSIEVVMVSTVYHIDSSQTVKLEEESILLLFLTKRFYLRLYYVSARLVSSAR